MKKRIIAVLTVALVFFLAACAVEPEGITLSATQISLEVGETFTVTAEVTPDDAEFDGLEWASANTNIVTVNSTGVLTAVGAGTTSVTVAAGEDVSAFIQVTVTAVTEEEEPEEEEPVEEEDPVAVQVSSDATDITVPYGTAVEDVVALLPATAVVEDEDGEEYDVDLRWVVLNYSATASPEEPEEYIASATFRLPDGVRLGTLVTKIDVFVTVQPTLARLALDAINEDPEAATLEDYLEAGIEGVTAANLSQLTAVLADAKGDVAFPDWSYADVQGVVDATLPSLLGTVYDVPAPDLVWDMTLEMDGTDLVSVEVRSGDLYAQFMANEINPLLLAFLEDNAVLLNNQRVSFEFTLETATTDKELIRMTYLELTGDAASTDLGIPNSLLFNGLIIDGMGYELNKLTVGANNLVLRNLTLDELELDGIARNIKVADSELDILDVNLTSTVTTNRLAISNELSSQLTLNLIGGLLLPDDEGLEVSGKINNLSITLDSELATPDGSNVRINSGSEVLNLVLPENVSLDVLGNSTIDGLSTFEDIEFSGYYSLVLKGLIELNGAGTIGNSDIVLDGAQLFDGDLNTNVEIAADSEGNEIHNSTVSGLLTVSAPLVMANPILNGGSGLDVQDGGEVTLLGGTLDNNYLIQTEEDGIVNFAAPMTITNGALRVNGDGEILGLANLPMEVEGELVSGQAWSLNVEGTALNFEWQSATTAGISVGAFTTAKTGTAVYTLTGADVGNVIRLVVSNESGDDSVTLAAIGPVDDNVWNATASSVTVLHDPSVEADTDNMELMIILKTENGYDLINSGDYSVSVTLGALTLTSQTVTLSSTGSAVISFTVTGAAAYENIGVLVASNRTGAATLMVGEAFDVTVTAKTPSSITLVTPTEVTELPANSSTDVTVLVKDIYGNPVPNAEVFFLAEGPTLESTTAFTAASYMTDAKGLATATMNVASNQLPGANAIDVSVSAAGVVATITGIAIREVVSANSTASVSGGLVTADASEDFTVDLDLENTFDLAQPITNAALEMLLVLGTLEDGTVVSTASALTWGSTTGSATFAIAIAGEHTLNLYVETFAGSGQYVLVQSGLSVDIETTAPAELLADPKTDTNVEIALGGSADVEVTVRDAAGNVLPGVYVEWIVKGATSDDTLGAGSATGAALTDANGVLAATLEIGIDEAPGVNAVQLEFTISGTSVSVEYEIDVLSLVDATNSSVDTVVTPSTITAGNSNLSVDLYLENASGTAINPGGYDIYLELADGTTVAAVSTSYLNGTATAVFSFTEAAVYSNVKVFVESRDGSDEFVELTGALNFTVKAAAVDPSKTTITPEDTALFTSKGDTVEMEVTVTDAFGNPVAGVTVSALLEGRLDDDTLLVGASNEVSVSALTGADGKATVTLEVGALEPRTNQLTVSVTVSDGTPTVEVYTLTVIEATFIPTSFVDNGDFSVANLSAYETFINYANNDGIYAEYSVVDGELYIEVFYGSQAWWNVQIFQDISGFEIGQTYKLTFDARAEAARSMRVELLVPNTDNKQLETGIIDLTTEMQTFEYIFTVDTALDLRLLIGVGNEVVGTPGVDVFIDNIVIAISDN